MEKSTASALLRKFSNVLIERMQTIELEIMGMSCGHCVTGVTQALLGVPGVVHADVSLSQNHAHVEHDGSTKVEALLAAVEEEGYQANLARTESQA